MFGRRPDMQGELLKVIVALTLLVVFILTGQGAYYSIKESMEEYPAPRDYLQGDSYDLEKKMLKLASETASSSPTDENHPHILASEGAHVVPNVP